MEKRDYYEVLGLSRNAGDEEIKRAYRKMAVQYHPDRNREDANAEEKFKEVNEAYQILSDPQKRAAYDQFGHAGPQGAGFGFEQGFGSSAFTDIFDNIFGDIFGGGRQGHQGIDLRYNLEISFEEAAFGTDKQISFEKESNCQPCGGNGAKPGTRPRPCKTCNGSGQVRLNQGFFTLSRTCPTCSGQGGFIDEKCPECRGRGRRREKHSLNVTIPAGIDDKQKLRLRGEGESASPDSPPGDLYVVIRVLDHPLFGRQGEHVHLELPVSFVQAALGASIEVPTLSGATTLKLKAGAQTGELFRLRAKGIKRLNGSGYGDQIVTLIVETPTQLTSRQKQLLREFEQEASNESQPGVSRFLNKFKEMLRR